MSKATELAETLDRWVGIGEASRLLGVRPATVRRWTKQDRLKAFVTPGGHRRYKVGDLLEYTDRNLRSEEEAAGLAALTATDRREEVSEAREQSWYGLLDRSDRDAYRERGRETLRLIESFLGDGDGSDELITAMEGQGARYGNHAAGSGDVAAGIDHRVQPVSAAADRAN